MEKPGSRSLTPTELARNLSETINEVRYRATEVTVYKAEEPICRIVPYGAPSQMTGAELVELLRSAPKADADYLDTVEKLAKKQPRLPRSPWGR
jgi:antitoxin (DNA-binding transcriptional repressor) of toxin-antitoxin stability system